jgi:hypothetical protein
MLNRKWCKNVQTCTGVLTEKRQAEEFGEYFEQIIRIECDAEGTNPKLTECKNVP